MNVTIQIPSTRPTTRGLSSPRKNLINTRPISPRKRVQQIRKLPSLDTRSLLANPNLEYSQPAYILEQKLHLSPEVEALRKEVTHLRENYQILLNTLQEHKNENDVENDGIDDIYDEIAQHELSKKLSHKQAEVDELEKRISAYNSSLTEETESDLNNYVTAQRQSQSQLESEIEMQLELTEQRKDLLADKKSTSYYEMIEKNDMKISQLTQLLRDLREEEILMLKMHQDIVQTEPSNIEANQEINFYKRKLQMAQHVHARKLVDMKKKQRELQQEKAAVIAIKQSKEETEKKRQQRIAFHDIYKKKAQILEENSRAASQVRQAEEKPQTVLTKTRRKHKHRHWHHHRPNDEASQAEDEGKSQNDIVVEENLDIVQKPITFKTEVEKVNSLHIGKKTE